MVTTQISSLSRWTRPAPGHLGDELFKEECTLPCVQTRGTPPGPLGRLGPSLLTQARRGLPDVATLTLTPALPVRTAAR
jgi:hypothetical protein